MTTCCGLTDSTLSEGAMTGWSESAVASHRSLAGKIAIVIGSSRGMGRAIAQRLGQEGATVIVTYLTNSVGAAEVVRTIQGNGSEAIAIQVDMREVASVRHLFEQVLARFKRIDILIINAFGKIILKPTKEMPQEDYDSMFAITRGVYFALQEAALHLAPGGRIISISTALTITSRPTAGAYIGCKAAIEQFSIALAKEVGWRGITVNTISPSVTGTDDDDAPHRIAPALPLRSSPSSEEVTEAKARSLRQQTIDRIVAQTPLGRLATPEDIASVVALLVSEDARWITGQNIRATGGLV
jgi:3-oxoacyl-[acyl-carrier protein] reductase